MRVTRGRACTRSWVLYGLRPRKPRRVSINDVPTCSRLYLMGFVRNDKRRANAIGEVVFGGGALRTVARAYRFDPQSLRRQVKDFRKGFRSIARGKGLFTLLVRQPDEDE